MNVQRFRTGRLLGIPQTVPADVDEDGLVAIVAPARIDPGNVPVGPVKLRIRPEDAQAVARTPGGLPFAWLPGTDGRVVLAVGAGVRELQDATQAAHRASTPGAFAHLMDGA